MAELLAGQPEARPWLELVSVVLEGCADPAWERAATETRLQTDRAPGSPLLAGAIIPIDAGFVEAWLRRVLAMVGQVGPEAGSLRAVASASELAPLALMEAAINADDERLEASGIALGVDAEPLSVAAGLAAIPLLQALRRRFGGAVDPAWSEGTCPVCGDWPLLAEQRGLERARRLRCGRCGSDWAQPGVRCPYCATTGLAARSELVATQDGESRRVETCTACHGYLKSVSTLRAWTGDEILLADLATVDLDLVALERGFTRPMPRRLGIGVEMSRSRVERQS